MSPVPEIAIDKDNNFLSYKDNVRYTGEISFVSLTQVTAPPQSGA
jgi:hypothetical protein